MSLNPEQLLTFALVARLGSLSAAAEAMHLTQPAVSNQMSRLQAEVGERLFVRHRLGVTLTAAGEALLPQSNALARALERAESVVGELRGVEAGRVAVAASTTVASYLMPGVLARYREEYPGVGISLRSGNTAQVVGMLEHGGVELAAIEGPVEALPFGVERTVFFRDEVVLVTGPDHGLAGREAVRPDELTGLDIVRREEGSGTREVAEAALAGVSMNNALDMAGSEGVKEAVLAGVGVAFLSRLAVEREVRAGILSATSIATPEMIRNLTLLSVPEAELSRAAKELRAMLLALSG